MDTASSRFKLWYNVYNGFQNHFYTHVKFIVWDLNASNFLTWSFNPQFPFEADLLKLIGLKIKLVMRRCRMRKLPDPARARAHLTYANWSGRTARRGQLQSVASELPPLLSFTQPRSPMTAYPPHLSTSAFCILELLSGALPIPINCRRRYRLQSSRTSSQWTLDYLTMQT